MPRGHCGWDWAGSVLGNAQTAVTVRLTTTSLTTLRPATADCTAVSGFVSCADAGCVPRKLCGLSITLDQNGDYRSLFDNETALAFVNSTKRRLAQAMGLNSTARVRILRVLPGGGVGTEVQLWIQETFAPHNPHGPPSTVPSAP